MVFVGETNFKFLVLICIIDWTPLCIKIRQVPRPKEYREYKDMAFTFRQRAGKLNWKIVSSVNVDNVVENSDTVELQSVIDIVTFSEFAPADVKANTVDSVSQLVNIMQLVIEYLLFCQESQYRLVSIHQEKNNALKHKISVYKRELAAIEEDNKIYQRQLQLLRKSLSKTQSYIGQPTAPRVILGSENIPPDQLNANSKQPFGALMETIMQHERDNREFLKSLLDDQRSTFFSEMNRLTRDRDISAFGGDQRNTRDTRDARDDSSRKTDEIMEQMTAKLCRQIETIMQTTVATMSESSLKLASSLHQQQPQQQHPVQSHSQEAQTRPAVATATTSTLTSRSLEGGDMLKAAVTLQEKDEQINQLKVMLAAERENAERERQRWEHDRSQMSDHVQTLRKQLSDATHGASMSNEQLSERCKKLTLTVLCKNFMSGK
jgi:hypothetical protein